MTCDVIIPAYNNAAVLPETLAALFAQSLPAACRPRVIVSDDGSTDETLAWLRRLSVPAPWQLSICTHPHAGASGARNQALKLSHADIIFLLGADILLRPDALTQHLAFHARHSDPRVAALGMVKWDPRLLPSPFMEWMVHGGQQNAFDEILGEQTADPRHYFYGSHLSLKRTALGSQLFRSSLTRGWEDLDLGRRLATQGLKLHVLTHAVGLHRHPYTVAMFAGKQFAAGYGLTGYQALHPQAVLIPQRSLFRHILRWLFISCGGQFALGLAIRLLGQRYSLPRLFMVYTTNQFWHGVWRSHGGISAYISQFYKLSSKKT